ncbi:class III poly(R)-hydroxyalkanoic acid synthase subunit PhaE [Aquimonas sp.]|jgi:class III poly(R)-hydroxyalkanoic acid synthase PhaE subunit|uniref:class III poly(R)-hydroxyalkanoic acid synthase subunit PhaE n=1 Tax=Aquimonas sp. TaxID=1872588 RepID=UPI0037C1A5D0
MSAATPDFASFDPARIAEQVMGFWGGLMRPAPPPPPSPFAAFQQMFGQPPAPQMPGMDLFAQAQKAFGQLQAALMPMLEGQKLDADGILQMWQKTFGDAPMLPPALMLPSFMAPLSGGGSPAFAAELRGALGSAPLGLMREHQERLQAYAQSQIDLHSAMERYTTLMQKVQREGMGRFEAKLRAHSEPGKQLGSARALFDLWVDAAEEAFAEAALSAEYRHIYGELVNAQMRQRQCGQAIVEEQLKSLGLPSRGELDSSHKRAYEMQRELRALKSRLAELELAQAQASGASTAAVAAQRPEAAPASASAPAGAELAAKPVAKIKPVRVTSARAQPVAPAKPLAKAKAAAVTKAAPVRPEAPAPESIKPELTKAEVTKADAAKPRPAKSSPRSSTSAAKSTMKSSTRRKSLPPLAAVTPKAPPARSRKGS